MNAILQIQGMRIMYGDKVAVRDLNFSLQAGDIAGLLGPNGAGKSSTMRAICGITPYREGKISVCGFDVAKNSVEVKRRVGFVAEDAEVMEAFTPIDYFRFHSEIRELSEKQCRERALETLRRLHFPESELEQGAEAARGDCSRHVA